MHYLDFVFDDFFKNIVRYDYFVLSPQICYKSVSEMNYNTSNTQRLTQNCFWNDWVGHEIKKISISRLAPKSQFRSK